MGNKSRRTRRRSLQSWLSAPYPIAELAGVVWRNIVGPTRRNSGIVSFLPHTSRWSTGSEELCVVFTGDWMPTRGRKIRFGRDLLAFMAPADLLVANYEGESRQPGRGVVMQQIHGPETLDALTRLAPSRRIVLSCANNHTADHGHPSFTAHFHHLESLGFHVAGSRERPVVQPIPGFRIAALTQWSNHPGPFLASLEAEAELAGGNAYNVLYPHWGFELELFPRPGMVETARRWLTRWDLVVGHHTHTPAPVAALDLDSRRFPVAFSLGNFVSASRMRPNRWGVVVRIFLGRDSTKRYQLRRLDWRFSSMAHHQRELVVDVVEDCPFFPGIPDV